MHVKSVQVHSHLRTEHELTPVHPCSSPKFTYLSNATFHLCSLPQCAACSVLHRTQVFRAGPRLDNCMNSEQRTQKGSRFGLAGNTVCSYPRDLGSRSGGGEIRRTVEFIKNSSNLWAHVSESVPTQSGPVSAWSSAPLRIHTWRWNVVRVITSMYPLSVITPFPKYGNCFGKWALA